MAFVLFLLVEIIFPMVPSFVENVLLVLVVIEVLVGLFASGNDISALNQMLNEMKYFVQERK